MSTDRRFRRPVGGRSSEPRRAERGKDAVNESRGQDGSVLTLGRSGRLIGRCVTGAALAAVLTGFGELELDPPIERAFEAYFESATEPRFVLDLRGADPDASESGWLFESRPFRAISLGFDPTRAEDFWQHAVLARQYDAIVHFDSTGPTVLLPWLPPAEF